MLGFNCFPFPRADTCGYIFAHSWICLLLDLKLAFALVPQDVWSQHKKSRGAALWPTATWAMNRHHLNYSSWWKQIQAAQNLREQQGELHWHHLHLHLLTGGESCLDLQQGPKWCTKLSQHKDKQGSINSSLILSFILTHFDYQTRTHSCWLHQLVLQEPSYLPSLAFETFHFSAIADVHIQFKNNHSTQNTPLRWMYQSSKVAEQLPAPANTPWGLWVYSV